MPRSVALFVPLLGLSLGAAGLVHAQPMPGAAPPAAQHGGCAGMCGMGGTPAQSTPMPGMMMQQGQGGMMQGGCPMMRRTAQLEERLRRLEERSGVPTPPPGQTGTPPG